MPARYEELCESYAGGIPCAPDFHWPRDVLDDWARRTPATLAILWVAPDFSREQRWSYAELSDASHRMAVYLASAGVVKGSRVLIVLPKVVDWWIVVFGLMRIGAIPIPGTSQLVGKDLAYRAKTAKATAFVGDDAACVNWESVAAGSAHKVYQVRKDGDALGKGRVDITSAWQSVKQGIRYVSPVPTLQSDLAMLYFTSGTTGNPKIVLLEQQYLLGHHITGEWYRLKEGSLFSSSVDLGWAKASYWTFGTFNKGASLWCQPPPAGAFSPLHLLEGLHRYPIEVICAPPTIYRSLVTKEALAYAAAHPPKALRHCVGAGEPLNPSVIREWRDATGVEINDGYGQSETVIVVANFEGVAVRPGSMGKAAPGVTMAIIGPNGVEEPGVEGEIAVRTDQGGGAHWIFKGYLKDGGEIDLRQKSFPGAGTWYCTGDRGFRDEDDYFWFAGRDDDIISSAGYRIGPFETESTLKEHPAVLESAVVASPHPTRHEIVKAFIVLSADYQKHQTPEQLLALTLDIQAFCKAHSAPYKYPREIEYVAELPKTVSGKIRRVELRNLEYSRKKHIADTLRSKL